MTELSREMALYDEQIYLLHNSPEVLRPSALRLIAEIGYAQQRYGEVVLALSYLINIEGDNSPTFDYKVSVKIELADERKRTGKCETCQSMHDNCPSPLDPKCSCCADTERMRSMRGEVLGKCETCQTPHDTCPLNPNCSCCADTFRQEIESEMASTK